MEAKYRVIDVNVCSFDSCAREGGVSGERLNAKRSNNASHHHLVQGFVLNRHRNGHVLQGNGLNISWSDVHLTKSDPGDHYDLHNCPQNE